jgi:hypothetical protein
LRKWIDVLKAKGTTSKGAKTYVEVAYTREREANDRERPPIPEKELRDLFLPDVWKSLRTAFVDGTAIEWLLTRSLSSKRPLLRYAANIAANRGWRALWDTPKVVTGTIHSTKGGEADHVFLAPDLSAAGWEEWQSDGERRDSVRRMFYVGMTRARRTLHILERSNVRAVDWEL